MAHQIKVILNPYGGRLSQEVKVDRVKQALRQAHLDFELELTQQRGHGLELAYQAKLAGWPIVVAAGGDGLVNEVVNGLLQAAGEGEAGILGIIPLGTANDLAVGLELPLDLAAASQRLAAGQTRLIDVGRVNDRYFVNNSAIGLEPMVTAAQERIRWVKGKPRYLIATLQTIIMAKFWPMRLAWNDNDNQFDGLVTLVSIGNNRRTGGAFYLTPQAALDDGRLDFVFATRLSRWQMLRLLPQTFTGTHIRHPQVIYHQTNALTITASRPTFIQVDGDIIETEATQINYRLIPAKLRVLV